MRRRVGCLLLLARCPYRLIIGLQHTGKLEEVIGTRLDHCTMREFGKLGLRDSVRSIERPSELPIDRAGGIRVIAEVHGQ